MSKIVKRLNLFFDSLHIKISKRSVILFSVLALVMIIPTVFAIYFAYFYEDDSFLSYNNISIELYDSEGVLLFSDEASKPDIENYADLKMFYELKTNSLPLSEKPADARTATYRLVYSEGDDISEYICHFAETADESFLESSSGVLYSVSKAPYEQFLRSPHSEKVHPESSAPMLFTSDEQKILPNKVSWNYKRDGKFAKSENFNISDTVDTYSISGAINLSFDKKPDICTAEVYNLEGEQIYSGSFSGLSSLSFAVGETVSVNLNATWKNTGASICYGKLEYSFNVLLATQAEFAVSADKLHAGELLVLSVKNAPDINRIKYSANISAEGSYADSDISGSYIRVERDAVSVLYAFKPKFSNAGDTKLALIPLPSELPSGTFVFTISSGASSKSFSINITAKDKKYYNAISKTADEFGKVISTTKFKEALATLEKPKQDIIFYSSAFNISAQSIFTSGYSFGNIITSSDKKLEFTALGCEYISKTVNGQSVIVLNNGTVVGKGYSEALGNYVAVEHGLGIRTWYCFLSDVSVSIGDILKKGDIIGKSGKGSALSSEGFLLLCSVYDVIIDPNFLLGKTFLEVSNEDK